MADLAHSHKLEFQILHRKGTYLIKGTDFLKINGASHLVNDLKKEIYLGLDFFNGQPIDQNPEYGFRQLAEVAIKALSPGINDPATAVLSINALSDLFAHRLHNCLEGVITDEQGQVVIRQVVPTFEELFKDCVYPIWEYGKGDQYIKNGLLHMLDQLKRLDNNGRHTGVLNRLYQKVAASDSSD